MGVFEALKKRRWAVLTLAQLVVAAAVFGAFVVASFSVKELQSEFNARCSKALLASNGEILTAFLNKNEQWQICEETVPTRLKTAVLAYEDARFFSHFGVDLKAVLRAAASNARGGKTSGASTISMQTIKLFSQQKRTFFNKITQTLQAVKLDLSLPKEEILKLYLNNAPYGKNIVGFASAASFYFQKLPNALSWAEAAMLAVLPNSPNLLVTNPPQLKAKRDALLAKLSQNGAFDASLLELFVREELPAFTPRKNLAPHLARRLLQKGQTPTKITSTIRLQTQRNFEKILAEFAKKTQAFGIDNAAALLVETASGEVVAYVGSQEFLDSRGGQIDGVAARRSVGSTLKPLLFAAAIDEGLVLPESLLIDSESFFASFAPQNAHKKFHGLVRAKEALATSLNVPFVHLLQDFGVQKFADLVTQMADLEPQNAAKWGLSYILGSQEMSLQSVVKLYLLLGNLGVKKELSFTKDKSNSVLINSSHRLLTKGSSWLTLQALREVKSPFGEGVSWKSGTSYGRRDAWAVGTTPAYTLGVWVGNFNGEANANLYGVSVASELFFALLQSLKEEGAFVRQTPLTQQPPHSLLPRRFQPQNTAASEFGEFVATEDLKPIKLDATGYDFGICQKLRAAAGEPRANLSKSNLIFANPCSGPLFALRPKEAKRVRTSPFLQKIYEFNGKRVDSSSGDFAKARAKIALNLPPQVEQFLVKTTRLKPTSQVKILYPTSGLKLLRTRGFNGENEFVISVANPAQQQLFYYLDERLVFQGAAAKLPLKLSRGSHKLFVISQSGASDEVSFSVE